MIRARAAWLLVAAALMAPAASPAASGRPTNECFADALSEGRRRLTDEFDAEAARDAFERAVQLARAAADAAALAAALTWLAEAHFELGNMEQGLDLALEAVESSRRSGAAPAQAWALLGLGDARFHLGQMELARDCFERAREMFAAGGDVERLADARKSLGATLKELGLDEDAVTELEAAQLAYRALGQWHAQASAAEMLAEAWYRLGDANRALALLEEVLRVAEDHGSDRLLVQAEIRIGILHLWVHRPAQALAHLERASALGRRLQAPPLTAWALQNQGIALAELGRTEEALTVRLAALDLLGAVHSPYYRSMALADLANLYRPLDAALALKYGEEALAILDRLDYPQRWSVRLACARALRALGQTDRAIESLERAVDELERTRSGLASLEHRAAFGDQHHDVYRELVDALLDRSQALGHVSDAERAFELSELARAQALVEALAENRVTTARAVAPELARRERVLEAKIASLQRRLIELPGDDDARTAMLADLAQAEVEMDLLVTEIRKRDPRYAALRYPEVASASATLAGLDDDAAMVSYFILDDGVAAFVLSGERLVCLRLALDPHALEARVANYVDLLSRGADSAVGLPTGWRLEQDLLAPVRAVLPGGIRRLIVIPDGALHFLPFEALPTTRAQPLRFLLDDHAVSYAPSATVLAQIARAAPPNARDRLDLLLLADPAPPALSNPGSVRAVALFESEGIRVPAIPYSAAEARAVRRIVGGRSRVYTGSRATERRLEDDTTASFRILHIASHAFVSLRRPARSALLLAASGDDDQDGLVQVREIQRLDLADSLVVLSACRSAQGRLLEGEGAQGLARAFLQAGARAVVASLWNVDDEQTAEFMAAFYRRLARGRPSGDALREAQLERRARAPRSAWAGFVLIGDGGSPALTPRPRWPRIVAWLAVVAAVVALAAWRALRRGYG